MLTLSHLEALHSAIEVVIVSHLLLETGVLPLVEEEEELMRAHFVPQVRNLVLEHRGASC